MVRIQPLDPPYDHDTGEQLGKMMPPGVDPILLFRTFARNLPMTAAMGTWGTYELSRDLSVSLRDREILIDRTCARCRCEYEWGVHIAFFAERVGFDRDHVHSLTHGQPSDPCWTDPRDSLLIAAVDALCDTNDIDDALWARLAGVLFEEQLLDLTMLCGWYHAISFTARSARVCAEPGAPRFADV